MENMNACSKFSFLFAQCSVIHKCTRDRRALIIIYMNDHLHNYFLLQCNLLVEEEQQGQLGFDGVVGKTMSIFTERKIKLDLRPCLPGRPCVCLCETQSFSCVYNITSVT